MSISHPAVHYDGWLVALSLAVAVLASYTALDVAGRIRAASGIAKVPWTIAASFAMGGGIWSMHFVAMLAFDVGLPVFFEPGLTILSLLVAVTVTGIGLGSVAYPSLGRRGPIGRILGGIIMGTGVAAMHYTGMAAMSMAASIAYDPLLVVLSVVIAIVAATVALGLAATPKGIRHRFGAAIVMGMAIAGMHYTGMAAAHFEPMAHDGADAISGLHRPLLAAIVAGGTIIILAIGIVSAALDRRFAAFSEREAETLRRSERRFLALLQSSSDIIFLIGPDGTIEYVVPTAETILGISMSDLVGWPLGAIVHPDERDTVTAALVAMADTPQARISLAIRIADPKGTRHFDLVACNLLGDPAVGGITVTLHDVTERREAEDAILRARALAEIANRGKSEFMANMSHELRTPLNAIIGFSEMMAQEVYGPLGDQGYVDYVKLIHDSGQQLLSLVNDILDISRIEAGQVSLNEETHDLRALLGASLRLIEARAQEAQVTLTLDLPDSMPPVRVDARKLKQIFGNLLSNAIKFTPPGGSVRIEFTDEPGGPCTVSITDTGIGIAPENIDRILEPFVQADGSLARKFEGAGLGLPIARSLALLHGGDLKITSTVNEGTKIRVILPAERIVRSSGSDPSGLSPLSVAVNE